jgi:HPr kinase/phosphorylase
VGQNSLTSHKRHKSAYIPPAAISMEPTINVNTLFSRFSDQLSLKWIAGTEGGERQLVESKMAPINSLVGHLNTIYPNRLQVLGNLELDYIASLDELSLTDLFNQIYANEPAAIIIAEGKAAPQALISAAEQYQTPLFCSDLGVNRLINELRHYLDEELADKILIHGVFMEVQGMGVLLTGESGIGKSELALELVTRHHRLIADDAPVFTRIAPDIVRGSCPETLRNFLEVRGLGILNIRAMYGDSAIKFSKNLQLIIHLEEMALEKMQQVNRLHGSYGTKTVLNVEVPMVTIPVASGRNLAVLVEAAVRHHILLRKGYNAVEAFIGQQQQLIQQQDQGNE